MRRCVILLNLLLLNLTVLCAQDWPFRLDYVENISPLQYHGDIQVWDIACGDGDYVYFATASGLSVWDGVRWTQYKSEYDSYLRSLYYDGRSGRIYSAGNNEFGYWLQDDFGNYSYVRLWDNERADVVVFWRCCEHEEKIYFQAHNVVFVYDPLTEHVEGLDWDLMGRYMHKVGGELFIQAGASLQRVSGTVLEPLGLEIEDRIVYVGRQGDRLVLVTESSGVLVWDGGDMRPLDTATNEVLSKARVFSAAGYSDGQLAVGTILDGLYIIDGKGDVVSHIGPQCGLCYTTVLSVNTDISGRIWLGLDGGAAMVDNRNSDMYYFSTGEDIGSVYTSAIFRDKLYLGTNKGLYELDDKLSMRFVPGSQGQVWSLFNAGDNLVVCRDQGLYALSGRGLVSLPYPSAWCFRPYADDTYFSVDMGGLSIYEIRYGRLIMRNKLEGFNESHNNGFADKYGYIWMVDRKGTPVRVKPDRQLRSAESVTRYEVDDLNGKLLLCSLDNEVVFYTDGHAYMYDIGSDKLKMSAYYSELIAMCGGRPSSVLQVENSFFYISDNLIGLIERRDGKFLKRGNIMPGAAEMMIPREFRTLIKLGQNIVSAGVQNGIAFHNTSLPASTYLHEIGLRKMNVVVSGDVIPVACGATDHFNIPGSHQRVELYFTGLTPYKTIDYRIDHGEWVTEVVEDAVVLTELPVGRHTLEVRNAGYDEDTSVFSAVFEVESAWYQSRWFMSGIVLLIALGIIGFNGLYIRRLERKHKRIRELQAGQMRRQSELHEMEMMRLEMKEKDKKLINFTMEGISRNNMLNEIREEVTALQANLNNNPDHRIKKIVRRIDSHLNDKQTWDVFKKYYNNIYDGFFDRLTLTHPDLTPNEMKICAYLKLNLSSKEIAVLMNISTSSVEIARHRLRKKLNLPKEKSLVGYMSEI